MLASRRKVVQLTLIILCMTALLVRPRSSLQRLSADITTHTTIPNVHRFTTLRVKSLCQDDSDDGALPVPVLSNEVVVHRVYFDSRRRSGYFNTTVFFVETRVKKLPFKPFAGCRIGAFVSDKVRYRRAVNDKFFDKKKNATNVLTLVECYDIRAVRNGDSAFLFYNSPTGLVEVIESLKPLFVPEPRPALKPFAPTVVVCVGVVHTGAHAHEILYHWLRYQKVIGVDHVHMSAEDKFVRAGGLQNIVIKKAINNGYLSIDFWSNWLTPYEVYNISQSLAYQDCLYRFQGLYDYVIYAESEDFFVPVKRSKSIKHYLQKWCSSETATCQFKWIRFFPDCGWDPKSIGADGNFTCSVTYKKTIEQSLLKHAHQLKALVEEGTDFTGAILDGYIQRQVPMNEAYFARVGFGYISSKQC